MLEAERMQRLESKQLAVDKELADQMGSRDPSRRTCLHPQFSASPTNADMVQACHDGQQLRIDRIGIGEFRGSACESRAWHGFKRAAQ